MCLKAAIQDGNLWETDDTFPVPWWSFTKTCLAAAALVLVGQGQLKLDEPLSGKPYTLHQLLQHRAGIPDYSSVSAYHQAVEQEEIPWPASTLLSRSNASQLIYPPGEGWAYSNIGYYFLRRLLENLTGKSLEVLLAQLVFDPLGISGVRIARKPADLAHVSSEGKQYHPDWVYHGLLLGTPAQAAQVLHVIMTSDFLPASLLEEMKASFRLNASTAGRPWQEPGYGLGLMINASEKGWVYGHTGQGPGSVIAVYHFSDLSPTRTVAVFQQTDKQGDVETQAVNLA